MSERKKSNARLKFISVIFIGWAAAAVLVFSDYAILNLIMVMVFVFCAISTMLIRCENCDTLLYRRNKKEHGLPSPAFLFPATKCPVCGIERR